MVDKLKLNCIIREYVLFVESALYIVSVDLICWVDSARYVRTGRITVNTVSREYWPEEGEMQAILLYVTSLYMFKGSLTGTG